MKPIEDENYYFYRLYSINFDSVLHSLRLLKRYRRKDVRYCILRDLVIAYIRPFSGNKGDINTGHCLKKSDIPAGFRSLHKELFDLRMQLFAHTDYRYYKPKIAKWVTSKGVIFPMSFRGYDYEKLDRRVAEIEGLVKAAISCLNVKIRKIECNF